MKQDLESRLEALEEQGATLKQQFLALVGFLGKTPYFKAEVLESAINGPIAEQEVKLGQPM